MAYVDQYTTWGANPLGQAKPAIQSAKRARRTAAVFAARNRVSRVAPRPTAMPPARERNIAREKQEILAALKEDKLIPDAKAKLTYQITAFLLLVFFPLGLAFYCYSRMFGPNLRLALTLFSMWWLNFSIIVFLLP